MEAYVVDDRQLAFESPKKTLLRCEKSIEVQSGVAASRKTFDFTPWHRHSDFSLFLTRDYE